MGVLIDLCEALLKRLDDQTDTGGTLVGVKSVVWGGHDTARKGNNLPAICLSIETIDEVPIATRGLFVELVTVKISVFVSKLGNDINRYYDTVKGEGALYWYEKIKNALDNNALGSMDLSIDATANDYGKFTCEFDEGDDVIEMPIKVQIQTKQFTKGAR